MRKTLCFFKAVCSPPSRSHRVAQNMLIGALLLNGFGQFTWALLRVWFFAFVPRCTCAPGSRCTKLLETVATRVDLYVPGAQEEAHRNGVEIETNKEKSSSCDVSVTYDDVRCFVQTVLDFNWSCAICISHGLIWQKICYLTLSLLLFLTNSVVVITQ